MPKYAHVNIATGELAGGGCYFENHLPEILDQTLVPVADDFDIEARDKRWTGTEWVTYAPPVSAPPAQGRAFRRALAVLVDGADTYPRSTPTPSQLDRIVTLWASPRVAAFMSLLDSDILSVEATAVLPRLWAAIVTNSDVTVTEQTRALALAPTFGIALT